MKYPKQVISQEPWCVGRTYEMLSVREGNGFVLGVVRFREKSIVRPDDPFYTILAFPIEEGIGGRSMHQWNSAHVLGYYVNQDAAEYDMMGLSLKGWTKERAVGHIAAAVDPRW